MGTEKAWNFCKELKKPTFIMIKRKDKDTYDFDELVQSIRDKFGAVCVPASYPIKPEMLEALNELIAETDEELMNKYFDEGVFTDWEFNKGLRNGVAAAEIVPVFAFDPEGGQGVTAMLDIIRKFSPSPLRHAPYKYIDASGGEDYAVPDADAPVTTLTFKTLSDPFVGKISIMKVITGELKSGMELINTRTGKVEKLNKLIFLRGKTQIDTQSASMGDIVAVPKLTPSLKSTPLPSIFDS